MVIYHDLTINRANSTTKKWWFDHWLSHLIKRKTGDWITRPNLDLYINNGGFIQWIMKNSELIAYVQSIGVMSTPDQQTPAINWWVTPKKNKFPWKLLPCPLVMGLYKPWVKIIVKSTGNQGLSHGICVVLQFPIQPYSTNFESTMQGLVAYENVQNQRNPLIGWSQQDVPMGWVKTCRCFAMLRPRLPEVIVCVP